MHYRNSLEQKYMAIKEELGKVRREIVPVLKLLKSYMTYLEPVAEQLKKVIKIYNSLSRMC